MKKIMILTLTLAVGFYSPVQPVIIQNISAFPMVIGAVQYPLNPLKPLGDCYTLVSLVSNEIKDIDIAKLKRIHQDCTATTDTLFSILSIVAITQKIQSSIQAVTRLCGCAHCDHADWNRFFDFLTIAHENNAVILTTTILFNDTRVTAFKNCATQRSYNFYEGFSPEEHSAIERLLETPLGQRMLWGTSVSKAQTKDDDEA